MDKKKLRKRMTAHLNGGPKFSELHYRVTYDGKDTPLSHHRRTDGRPSYKITQDEWHNDEDQSDWLDAMGKSGDEVMAWLRVRIDAWLTKAEVKDGHQ